MSTMKYAYCLLLRHNYHFISKQPWIIIRRDTVNNTIIYGFAHNNNGSTSGVRCNMYN